MPTSHVDVVDLTRTTPPPHLRSHGADAALRGTRRPLSLPWTRARDGLMVFTGDGPS
jgi:hypothetical protein